MNVARSLENTIDRLTLVGVVGISLTTGFLLCLFSFILKIGIQLHSPEIEGKEVGFLLAPNWTIVYMVLFPLYLAFFSSIISSIKTFFSKSVGRPNLRLITGTRGAPVGLNVVSDVWNAQLRRLSILLYVLGAGVTISSVAQWIVACYEPYSRARDGVSNILNGEVWDWSTVPYLGETDATPVPTLWFTGVAYTYMALALFIYLAILAYCAYFTSFMARMADSKDRLRLLIRGAEPKNFLNEVFTYIYTLSFLGLCAAYFMRLQALYLNSDRINIYQYWFSDFLCLVYSDCGSGVGQQFTASIFTSILQATYTLIMLTVSILELSKTYSRSKNHYLLHIGDPKWRRSVLVKYDAEFVAALRKGNFVTDVVPHYIHLAIPIALMIVAIFFPYVGSLFVVAVVYAAIALLLGNFNRPDSPMPEPQDEDAVHFKPLKISVEDKEDIILLLSHQANTSPISNKYYSYLIEKARIPDEYKYNINNTVNSATNKSAALVDAAIDQGENALGFDDDKTNSTVLGSVLIAAKDYLGLDFQCLIVRKLQVHRLVESEAWLAEMSQRTCGVVAQLES